MRNVGIRIIALVVLVTTSLHAGVIPGRWEKVDALQPRSQIVLSLKTGEHIEGAFVRTGADELTVIDQNGSERKFPKSEVLKIVSRKKRDQGTLVGLAAGFGVGAVLGFLFGRAFDNTAGGVVLVGGIGAGIGALIGYGAGKLRKGTEVLYQAS